MKLSQLTIRTREAERCHRECVRLTSYYVLLEMLNVVESTSFPPNLNAVDSSWRSFGSFAVSATFT